MIELKGKVAVVTGGGSGIGAAVATHLIDRDVKVALWDKVFTDNAPGTGERIECDVTSEKEVISALDTTKTTLGVPHYLVNCAGIISAERIVGRDGPASLDVFEKTLTVNLAGSFNTMRLVANMMAEQTPHSEDGERGVIVNLASVAAYEGQIGQVAYAASKGGIISMTLPAARELARIGIRVNCIAPGIVDTPMMAEVPDDYREKLESTIPFPKRYVRPAEIGLMVTHIFENPVINGEVIRVDGAMRLPPK